MSADLERLKEELAEKGLWREYTAMPETQVRCSQRMKSIIGNDVMKQVVEILRLWGNPVERGEHFEADLRVWGRHVEVKAVRELIIDMSGSRPNNLRHGRGVLQCSVHEFMVQHDGIYIFAIYRMGDRGPCIYDMRVEGAENIMPHNGGINFLVPWGALMRMRRLTATSLRGAMP